MPGHSSAIKIPALIDPVTGFFPLCQRRTRRFLNTWTVAAATIVLVCSTPFPVAAGEPDKISVAYCIDCVPFHFKDEHGEPAGMIIDMWRLWSEKTNIKIDFQPAPWDETLRMMAEGRADAHAGLFFNQERATFLEYGSPLTKTDTHFFVKKGLPPVEDVDALAAYRVGVIAGDYVEGYLKERLPEGAVVRFQSYDAIMAALREGRLRVFAADTPTGIFHLQKSGLGYDYEFPADKPLYRSDWHVAAKKGEAELIKVIDRGMALITAAERHEIEARWIALEAEGFELTAQDIAALAVFLGLISIAGVLIWNRLLRRQIDLRTGELETELAERKRTESALRESQKLLQTILDHMPTPVYLRDLQGRYLLINRGYEEVHGVTRDGVRGKTLHQVFPKELADDLATLDPEVASQRRVLQREETLRLPGGERIMAVTKFPIFDSTGEVEAIGGVDVDITERKRAEDRANKELMRIEEELQFARELQLAMVPRQFAPPSPERPLKITATMQPAREVGGDFYDVIELDRHRMGIVIADVSGKGAGAALFMARAFTILNTTARRGGGPGAVLSELNDALCVGNESTVFVSVFYGVFDAPTGVLTFANAGHNPPFLIRSDRSVEQLETTGGLVVGIKQNLSYLEKSVELGSGDTLFCYTDGITEAKNASMEEFSDKNLAAALGECGEMAVEHVADFVIDKVNEFTDHAPQFDDMTCVVIQRVPGERISDPLPMETVVTDRLTFEIANDLGQLPVVRESVDAFGERNDLPSDIVFAVKLAIEELVTNTISYGYADAAARRIARMIEVRLDLRGDRLRVSIVDGAMPFDPTSAREPDTKAALMDRPIGGLGIHLARNLMDDIDYRRDGERNRITLTKNLVTR